MYSSRGFEEASSDFKFAESDLNKAKCPIYLKLHAATYMSIFACRKV